MKTFSSSTVTIADPVICCDVGEKRIPLLPIRLWAAGQSQGGDLKPIFFLDRGGLRATRDHSR